MCSSEWPWATFRLGEVLGLTVDRVDFMRGSIRVDRQLVTPNQGAPKFGPPKTPSSVRSVPAADVVVRALARHLEQYPALGADAGAFEGLIFSTECGNPVRRSTWGPAWLRACSAAEVEGVRFHDLRHWFASALIVEGLSVKAVQKALGHKNATETLDIYGHLWPSDEAATRDAIERALGSGVAPALHDAGPAEMNRG